MIRLIKKFYDASKIINRPDFIIQNFLCYSIIVIISLLSTILAFIDLTNLNNLWVVTFFIIYGLIILIVTLKIFVNHIRRTKDLGLNRFFVILSYIPVIHLFWYLWPGTDGENCYGSKPKEPSALKEIVAILVFKVILIIFLSKIILNSLLKQFAGY